MTDTASALPRLLVYSRLDCHLCEDMLADLRDWADPPQFEIEVRDVDADPKWAEEFGSKVPVLFGADQELCHYYLNPMALREFLSGQSAGVS